MPGHARGRGGAAGDSEQAVRAGLRHELELVGLALEVAVLDPGPAAAVVAGGAEAVGKGLGGLDVEEAVAGLAFMRQLHDLATEKGDQEIFTGRNGVSVEVLRFRFSDQQ